MGETAPNECDPRVQMARVRADRIRTILGDLATWREQVLGIIRTARNNNDASALGYPSWTAYVAKEFGDVLPRLEPDERRPLVQELRALGMSTRDTAAVVGVHYSTVARDDSGVADATPVRVTVRPAVTGHDGKTYPARPPLRSVPNTVKPVAHKPRRRPLPEQWRDNQRELLKVVERYERHVADDRFPANRERLEQGCLVSLSVLIERLTVVHQRLIEDGGPS